MREVRLPDNQSLNDDRLDFFHETLHIVTFCLEKSQHRLHRSFVTLIILLLVLVLLELIVKFVDSIVGEMHEEVIQIRAVRRLILFGSKPCNPLLMKVYPERIHSIEKSVNSQIELEIVHQIRSMKVSLHDTPFVFACLHYVLNISRQEDALALTEPLRFYYESLLPLLFALQRGSTSAPAIFCH